MLLEVQALRFRVGGLRSGFCGLGCGLKVQALASGMHYEDDGEQRQFFERLWINRGKNSGRTTRCKFVLTKTFTD